MTTHAVSAPPPAAQLLTARDIATAAQISERTTRALIARGAIPSIRIGRCRRVRRADLAALLERGV